MFHVNTQLVPMRGLLNMGEGEIRIGGLGRWAIHSLCETEKHHISQPQSKVMHHDVTSTKEGDSIRLEVYESGTRCGSF